MSIDTIALLIFVILLSIFLIVKRKHLKTSSFLKIFYFSMFRTKLGMKKMDSWADKHRNFLKKLGYTMIVTGFLGMILMIEELIRGAILLIRNANEITVGVVLPIQAEGVFYVPFFYWIIAIVFIMVVHEFAHGIIARAHKVKVKSTGFAFLGAIIPIIPGAFVEIDEKHLAKKSKYAQLSIFAAGPFINIFFGFLFWGIFLLAAPAVDGLFAQDGMTITSIRENSPAAISGLAVNELITNIDGNLIKNAEDFDEFFAGTLPGDTISITTNQGIHEATLAGTEKSVLGVRVEESKHIKESVIASHGSFLPAVFVWLFDLLFWMFVLNLGVGLFNLVPLGPIDGGRMLHTSLQHLMKHKHAKTIWHTTSMFMLVIIVSTLLSAFF